MQRNSYFDTMSQRKCFCIFDNSFTSISNMIAIKWYSCKYFGKIVSQWEVEGKIQWNCHWHRLKLCSKKNSFANERSACKRVMTASRCCVINDKCSRERDFAVMTFEWVWNATYKASKEINSIAAVNSSMLRYWIVSSINNVTSNYFKIDLRNRATKYTSCD